MESARKEVAEELPGMLRVYTDGSVERLYKSPYVPPSPEPDPQVGVASKDITISKDPQISARLYLPTLAHPNQKIPILIYYHGGAFVIESAFGSLFHYYLEKLVSEAKVVVVSVDYRLAPEHPLPIAYEDCWAALQWVSSHSISQQQLEENNYSSHLGCPFPFTRGKETTDVGSFPFTEVKGTSMEYDSWLLNHADFNKLYLGGSSAGGNIVHNIAMRLEEEGLAGGLRIRGAFMGQPFFWGSEPIGSEPVSSEARALPADVWRVSYPTAENGVDHEMLNPVGEGKRSLKGLACSKILVHVAGNDPLRDRGVWYCEAVKASGWEGQVELVEIDGEDHAFDLVVIDQTDNGRFLMSKLVSFLTG